MKAYPTLIAAALLTGTLAPHHMIAAELAGDISQWSKPPTIKVLIGKQVDKTLLEAKGRYLLYNLDNGVLVTNSSSSTRAHLTTAPYGLKWGESIPGLYQMRLVPGDSQSTFLVDGIEYRGCLEVYDIQGKLYIINEVDIERYLKSILTAQFPNELGDEVMDAVAIVARTNAYSLVERKSSSPWHVEAADVGYLGYALTLQNIHVDRAISSTRHMVMTYHNMPFAASWTQNSAGKTAEFATIFRKEIPSPHGVDSVFAARDREKHSWSFAVSRSDLAKVLGARQIAAVDLYQDKETQKVYGMRVKDGAELRQYDFFKLQKALGANRLKSSDFTIETEGDQMLFKGFGEGHGVGLCLYSASAMADRGDKAPKILAAFFPDTKLQNIRTLHKEVPR
ncbi:MAG: SpoIID/LytB domain-containing protein [Verrucomicrobia bacterium]|nr:SpoIID/LytB domain-containing protein [Verrucomicrobiota bacterium]